MGDFNLKSATLRACGAFAVAVCLLVAIGYVAGWFGIEVVRSYASIAIACLFPYFQLFWFGARPIGNAPYGLRVAGFGASYLALLVFAAFVGGWMPFDSGSLSIWGGFLAIYLAILATVSVLFDRAFKKRAGSYQAALEAYKQTLPK